MISLSVEEFKRLCDIRGASRYIYAPENQKASMFNKTIKLRMIFDDMQVFVNPDRICFSNNGGCMWLNRVCKIIYEDEADCKLGDVFRVICNNQHMGDSPEYTILAR